MREFHTLDPDELERFVQRTKASWTLADEADLSRVFQQVLDKVVELVPSESGAILLDDPFTKGGNKTARLHFVAAFGPGSDELMGTAMPTSDGVAGLVYRTGSPYFSARPANGEVFEPKAGRYDTRSIIASPIHIGGSVCGTIELLNRTDGREYTAQDLVVLQVFAGYTGSTLQNALDARQARELAKVDDLTGLFNDRYLYVRLREELARPNRECALVFIDLDHFKPVNDTYGHLVGSQVLREIGFLLRQVTADREVVLARYGGDEFTALLPDCSLEEARGVAERIREAIAEATFLEEERGPDLPAMSLRNAVTASIGVATTNGAGRSARRDDRDHDPVRTLLRRADRAMYAAKEAGKNRVRVARSDGGARPPLAGHGRVS